MSGGGLTCPECGREHKSEKTLKRTRRKWKTAVVALLLIATSFYVKHQRHLIYHEGPIGLVPTIALVLVVDLDEYYQQRNRYPTGMYGLVESVEHRLYKMRASLISRRILARRLSKHWSHREGTLVKSYDVSGILPVVFSRPAMFFNSSWGANRKYELIGDPKSCWDLYGYLEYHAADLHSEYQVGWVDDIGDQWIVSASTGCHEWLGNSLRQIHSNCWSVGDDPVALGSDHAQVYVRYKLGITLPDESHVQLYRANQVHNYVMLQSRKDEWLSNGGDGAAGFWLKDDQFVIWATAEHHLEIMGLLNSFDLETHVYQYR